MGFVQPQSQLDRSQEREVGGCSSLALGEVSWSYMGHCAKASTGRGWGGVGQREPAVGREREVLSDTIGRSKSPTTYFFSCHLSPT